MTLTSIVFMHILCNFYILVIIYHFLIYTFGIFFFQVTLTSIVFMHILCNFLRVFLGVLVVVLVGNWFPYIFLSGIIILFIHYLFHFFCLHLNVDRVGWWFPCLYFPFLLVILVPVLSLFGINSRMAVVHYIKKFERNNK